MTYDGFNTYTYDAEGNITAVSGNASATYVYNALNQRVRTTVGSGTPTEFVFNANGQRVSEWNASTHAQLKGKYYWGGTPVAFYTTTASSAGAAAHFEHQDWLGTERMRTNYNSCNNPTYAVEGTYTSLPWGDDQTVASGSDWDAYHYATLDYDAETNTDHAQFRQYSNVQGHWMSPDPYYGSYDQSNPQSMNRYVYAMDNPLSYIDPEGLFTSVPCDEDGTACPLPPFLPPDPCSMDSFLPWCADPPCSGSDFYGFNCDPPQPGSQQPPCGNGINCAPSNLAAGPAAAPRTPYIGKCASTSTGPMAGIIFPCNYACTSTSGPDQPSVPISMRQLRKQCGWTGSGCPAFVTMQFIPSDLDLYLVDIEGYTVRAMMCSGSGGTGKVQ